MTYRELQAELKSRGLSAYGKKAILEKRLADADGLDFTEFVSEPEDIVKTGERSFVFTGDPNDSHNPGWLYMHGYQFHLNGKATKVTDDVAIKLATHTHFTEK